MLTFTEMNTQHKDKKYLLHPDLEVVITREGNEEVKKKTFAVFIDLWSIMVHTWKNSTYNSIKMYFEKHTNKDEMTGTLHLKHFIMTKL